MPATTIRWNTKILAAKIETTYGTDPVPTGAANAILAKDVVWTPMNGNDLDRELDMPSLGQLGSIPAELHAKLAFKVELAPSGAAGVAPGWGVLMRACGCAEVVVATTSVTYNPVTDNHSSVTFYLWIGGTRYVMRGARGNAKFAVTAQGIPYIEFEFTGLYQAPTETARSAPTLTGFQRPLMASDLNTPTFTISATDFILRSLNFDLGNKVETRFLINSEEVWITDKVEALEFVIEATLISTWNPFAIAAAMTTVPLVFAHGVGAGKIATLNLPLMQLQRPQALQAAQNIKEWSLRGVPLPNAGNDQWTLVLT
jgi:hypothetical protein